MLSISKLDRLLSTIISFACCYVSVTYKRDVFKKSFCLQKTATAVAYCKSGSGNIRVNGRPLDMVEPRVLQYKLQEPILLLGKVCFFIY